jgi:aldose 1-epimerase
VAVDHRGAQVVMTGGVQATTVRSDLLALEVLTAGAAVRRLVLTDADGTEVDVVLGHRDPERYALDGGYLGAVIGRLANRLDRGRFTLDGTPYQVPVNDRGNALHGGVAGFDAAQWVVESASDDAVTLTHVSPDGDQGFPGELRARVTYAVAGGDVRITASAVTDRQTVVNLTQHAYFNLDGEASGDVEQHSLQVDAGAYTPTRDDQIPTGEVRDVTGTPFDLRRARRLAAVHAQVSPELSVAGGLDHHFVVPGTGLRRAARVVGASGRSLEVLTDAPGVQVYTGAHFDGTTEGLSGWHYEHRAGIALEAQGFPDAPNHARFPSVVLRPGEVFEWTTVWRLRGR